MQGTAVVHAGSIHAVHGKDVIILHAVLITVIVVLTVMGNIMGGIDVNLSVENMSGRIRCKNMGDQWPALFTHEDSSFPYDRLDSLYNE
jgi:hypothetical protein